MTDFAKAIADGYATDGPAIELGRGVLDGELHQDAAVRIPLAMMNRHGLVAGATGTGKTRTLQLLAEPLSAAGVPVFAADVKGDLSGLAVPGEARQGGREAPGGARRCRSRRPASRPSTSRSAGSAPACRCARRCRTSGRSCWPRSSARTRRRSRASRSSSTTPTRRGCRCVDLADLRALLTFLDSDEGKAELKGIGGLSGATVGVLLRSLVGLEEGGGNEFFGEPQFAIADLLRIAPDGRGVISCLELPGVQDKPKLFSTALMWLLAELFEELPEAGDLDKPKLVFFFDEAHLLFDDATDAFLDSVAQTVRLIRSKGVGVFFVTQNPQDLPGRGARPARHRASSTRCARSRPTTRRR